MIYFVLFLEFVLLGSLYELLKRLHNIELELRTIRQYCIRLKDELRKI